MRTHALDTHTKAFQVNMDAAKYGTIAEIGAGQEVARWFFRVGGASGTIAKSISAYDMAVSNAIYGKSTRYVSRERLVKMLDHEYELLIDRLEKDKGDEKTFFAFANTVAASSYSRRIDAAGWIGIRFQHHFHSEPNNILIHVRLLDRENLQQQEALGILGVNLIYGAFIYFDNPNKILDSLLDGLNTERAQVNVVRFSGPVFADVDNRIKALHLVEQGMATSATFNPDGEVVEPSEILYKKPILVERGSFRPVTNTTRDMLQAAHTQFVRESEDDKNDVVILVEMTMRNLLTDKGIEPEDFLERVDILGQLGVSVMISKYFEYYRLAQELFRHTKRRIGIVMGVPSLQEIFDAKYYTHLDGGILESFGRMFKNDLRLYVYPYLDRSTGVVTTAETLQVEPDLLYLYKHLYENQFIVPITEYKKEYLPIFSREVLAQIQSGDESWVKSVPPKVAKIIKKKKLLGYRP